MVENVSEDINKNAFFWSRKVKIRKVSRVYVAISSYHSGTLLAKRGVAVQERIIIVMYNDRAEMSLTLVGDELTTAATNLFLSSAVSGT